MTPEREVKPFSMLAEDEKGCRVALDQLPPERRGSFADIVEAIAALPVTIRLLDPPLHELLPHEKAEFAEAAGRRETTWMRVRGSVGPSALRCG